MAVGLMSDEIIPETQALEVYYAKGACATPGLGTSCRLPFFGILVLSSRYAPDCLRHISRVLSSHRCVKTQVPLADKHLPLKPGTPESVVPPRGSEAAPLLLLKTDELVAHFRNLRMQLDLTTICGLGQSAAQDDINVLPLLNVPRRPRRGQSSDNIRRTKSGSLQTPLPTLNDALQYSSETQLATYSEIPAKRVKAVGTPYLDSWWREGYTLMTPPIQIHKIRNGDLESIFHHTSTNISRYNHPGKASAPERPTRWPPRDDNTHFVKGKIQAWSIRLPQRSMFSYACLESHPSQAIGLPHHFGEGIKIVVVRDGHICMVHHRDSEAYLCQFNGSVYWIGGVTTSITLSNIRRMFSELFISDLSLTFRLSTTNSLEKGVIVKIAALHVVVGRILPASGDVPFVVSVLNADIITTLAGQKVEVERKLDED
ncbi:hypothetical protein BDM02DRAFT_3130053 [Thelephora ganbajun]|uniref:Uncharacterized protein n=1 Tax=Thelephora ganbajun TaxID=370292 RepID=A0ACB6ZC44_THEGA|nr:hypothetical protein BDM02DRAFT_3130053 [Thelephora ganbajun]